MATLAREAERGRGRLHDLEGFAAANLEVQKMHRRAEERQYRKVANAIAFGGLAMAFAMVVLTVVTIVVHGG